MSHRGPQLVAVDAGGHLGDLARLTASATCAHGDEILSVGGYVHVSAVVAIGVSAKGDRRNRLDAGERAVACDRVRTDAVPPSR